MEKFMKYKMMYDLSGDKTVFNYISENQDDKEYIESALSFIKQRYVINYLGGSTNPSRKTSLLFTICCGEEVDLFKSSKFLLRIEIKIYQKDINRDLTLYSSNVNFNDNGYSIYLIKTFIEQDKIPTLFIKKLLDNELIKEKLEKYDVHYLTVLGYDFTLSKSSVTVELPMTDIYTDDLKYIDLPILNR